jgi:hypothetical protein
MWGTVRWSQILWQHPAWRNCAKRQVCVVCRLIRSRWAVRKISFNERIWPHQFFGDLVEESFPAGYIFANGTREPSQETLAFQRPLKKWGRMGGATVMLWFREPAFLFVKIAKESQFVPTTTQGTSPGDVLTGCNVSLFFIITNLVTLFFVITTIVTLRFVTNDRRYVTFRYKWSSLRFVAVIWPSDYARNNVTLCNVIFFDALSSESERLRISKGLGVSTNEHVTTL